VRVLKNGSCAFPVLKKEKALASFPCSAGEGRAVGQCVAWQEAGGVGIGLRWELVHLEGWAVDR
jgi:hypothetical protein